MRESMMKILTCISATILFSSMVGCVSLPGRGESKTYSSSASKNQASSKTDSLLARLFGDYESSQSTETRDENLNLSLDTLTTPSKNTMQTWNQMSELNLMRVDENTWRTAANPKLVYSIMTRVLAQSYIVTTVDRRNMNAQTDWDKFFIDGRLFRNRMSITVFPITAGQTEIVIKNSVEYYAGVVAKQEENSAWLPSPDITDEVSKLIETTNRQTAFAYSEQSLRR